MGVPWECKVFRIPGLCFVQEWGLLVVFLVPLFPCSCALKFLPPIGRLRITVVVCCYVDRPSELFQ